MSKARRKRLEKEERHDGILIYGGRAIEVSGGRSSSSSRYAKILNRFRQKLDASISMTSIMVPTAIAFYGSPNYQRSSRRSRTIVSDVCNRLISGVDPMNGYEAMAPHREEYIFYRTDHHWTALGAFYVYQEYARKKGFPAVERPRWNWKEGRPFLGSLYGITRAASLKNNRDRTVFPNPPIAYTASRFGRNWSKGKKGRPAQFINPAFRGYNVFLGGDFPLIIGRTSMENDRHVVLIKNSFGNAFAPFLLPHFETVTVVDYRYFEGHLTRLIDELEITDVIFLNTNSHIGSGYHRRRLKRLLEIPRGWRAKTPKSIDPRKVEKAPSLIAKPIEDNGGSLPSLNPPDQTNATKIKSSAAD